MMPIKTILRHNGLQAVLPLRLLVTIEVMVMVLEIMATTDKVMAAMVVLWLESLQRRSWLAEDTFIVI